RCRFGLEALTSGEARNAGEQRVQRRRAFDDQDGKRVAILRRFDKAFAEVQEVTARTNLAGAAEVGSFHIGTAERCVADDENMVRDDRAELERKHIERAVEL